MPQGNRDEARQIMDDHLADDIQHVEHEADKTTVAVEQALIDELISEQDYVEAKSMVYLIRKQLKQIVSGTEFMQMLEILWSFSRDFPKDLKKIENSHNERLSNFKKHWDKLLLALPKSIPSDEHLSKLLELSSRVLRKKI